MSYEKEGVVVDADGHVLEPWASDYPHIDASLGVVAEVKERLAPLPPAARRKVLGDNAVRFYQLAV